MKISKEHIIGDIVAEDYRTAAVFEQAGIDFCCQGSRTIENACKEQNISVAELIPQLQQTIDAAQKDHANIDYKSWPLDLLADFIEKTHHRYVVAQIPVIQGFLDKIVQVHGPQHPELNEIRSYFNDSAEEFISHIQKEETILFPFIRKMVEAKHKGVQNTPAHFGTVQNPIQMMMAEHDAEGERFRKIKALSNQYTAPADACNTYRTAYAHLKDFEEDLHRHIHLENNILFPKAIELEQSFV